MNFIYANLYNTQGKAINNFDRLLPDVQSDLAKETLKDPYNFDFLTLTENYKEKELEDALVANITKFYWNSVRVLPIWEDSIQYKLAANQGT